MSLSMWLPSMLKLNLLYTLCSWFESICHAVGSTRSRDSPAYSLVKSCSIENKKNETTQV